MAKVTEIDPDDTQIIDRLEDSLGQFLLTYSAATGIDYWSLMVMVFDISHGALARVDYNATVMLLDATTRAARARGNPPAQIDRRRKAMIRLLDRGHFLLSTPQGSA